MQFTNPSSIPRLHVVKPTRHVDHRGEFIKPFNLRAFIEHDIDFAVKEVFYTRSKKNVLRGMHFQTPPCDVDKFVFCVEGRAFDTVLDLRADNFGKHFSISLDASNGIGIFIPRGVAHGFLALEENTVLCYLCSQLYSPSDDKGIRWDSFGCLWPVSSPVCSERDSNLPALADFVSPFK